MLLILLLLLLLLLLMMIMVILKNKKSVRRDANHQQIDRSCGQTAVYNS